MSGPVEWVILIFGCTLMLGGFGLAWRARGILADLQINMAVKFSEYDKDIRHTKKAVEQHAIIEREMLLAQGATQKDVERLSRIVNGKH